MVALSCDELCTTAKPGQCTQAAIAAASAAAEAEHDATMRSIHSWPGGEAECPYGCKRKGDTCYCPQ